MDVVVLVEDGGIGKLEEEEEEMVIRGWKWRRRWIDGELKKKKEMVVMGFGENWRRGDDG